MVSWHQYLKTKAGGSQIIFVIKIANVAILKYFYT